MKSILMIGMGRFGSHLCMNLSKLDNEIMIVDACEEKLEDLDGIEKLYQDILEKKECVSLKDLAVTGNDLIEAGMSPGKEIGEKLEKLLELVIRKPEYNTKEELLKRL